MTATNSVSKGCFVFKGKKKTVNPDEYFNVKTKKKEKPLRLRLFHETWEKFNDGLENVQNTLNSVMFHELLSFIETSTERLNTSHEMSFYTPEIPTAALLTGVNTADHASMFTHFTRLIQEQITPHVAVLRSKECGRLKNLLTNVISQLSHSSLSYESDDESAVDPKPSANMADLLAHYNNQYSKTPSPSKKSRSKKRRSKEEIPLSKRPALVVIFEDFSSFSSLVLQDFLIICSNYISRLPIVLVFGIATNMTIIHRHLPTNVSSLLAIDKFSAIPSTNHLSQIIDTLLLTNEYSFKLGSHVFQLLLDIFLYHDLSVHNFVSALKFAVLDHFSSQPASCLCSPLETAIDSLQSFTSSEIEQIRQLPSFKNHVENLPTPTKKLLMKDDGATKTFIADSLRDLNSYHSSFYHFLRCLHCLVCKLPHFPLGKHVRELYALALGSNITECDGYKESMSLLSCLSKDELTETLNSIIVYTSNVTSPPDSLIDFNAYITESITKLADIDKIAATAEEQAAQIVLPKRAKLHDLKQTLSQIHRQRVQTPYEMLRTEILDKLHSYFEANLISPCTQLLHEVYYYDNITVMKERFYASPRASLQSALSNPHHYLQCECCKCDPGSILPSMPDICIAYKLHLECGRFINLYDWLQAFNTIIKDDPEDTSIEETVQARFIRAVSELQFLGFIKSTKRKTDHVSRLTWGGC